VKNEYIDIDDLIIRYLSGNTTSAENSILTDWIRESDDNKTTFNAIRNIWLATAQTADVVSALNIYSNNNSLNNDPDINDDDGQDDDIKSRPNVFVRIMKVAAVALITLTIGALGNQYFMNRNQIALNDRNMTIQTTLGSRALTTLPDGSKVWLNAGSRLDYTLEFGRKTRVVKLTGEAFFDVKTDSTKPFIVRAGKLAIKAYGTAFNVKAYPNENAITTTLVRGKVVIAGKDNADKDFVVNMKPNDKVAFFNDKVQNINALNKMYALNNKAQRSVPVIMDDINAIKEAEIKTELYTSWKDDRWVIEKRDIEGLVNDFERRYNIKILLTSDDIRKYHFTGTLQNETIEQVLVILRHTIPLKYKIDKGLITISEDERLVKEFKSANINIDN
jgi:ferric-dicitrate binding protein FerR (iron transport regulator)